VTSARQDAAPREAAALIKRRSRWLALLVLLAGAGVWLVAGPLASLSLVQGCDVTWTKKTGHWGASMRFRLVFVLMSVAALTLPAAASAISAPTTLSYTGGEQAYVVPSGVVTVGVAVQGAWGGQDNSTNGVNQAGEGITGYLSVTPGEPLYAEVGQNGAYAGGATFGGGGAAGDPPPTVYGGAGEYASSGGGASDVRTCSINATSCPGGGTSLGSRLIVAAGGGGWAGSGNGFSPTCAGPLGAGGANNVQQLPGGSPGGPLPVITAAGIVIPGLASNESSTVTTTYAGTSNAGFGSSTAGSGGVLSGCSSGGGNPTLTFSDSVAGSSGSGADGGAGASASGLPPFSGGGCTGTECADAGPGGGGGGGYFGGGGGATGYDSCLETGTSPPSSAPCNAAGAGQGGAGGSSFAANAVQFPRAPGVLGNTGDQFIKFVPAIEIDTPANGAVYAPGQSVNASWSCGYDAATALGVPDNNCVGTVVPGGAINTSPGTHTFTVAGKVNNNSSDSLSASVTYTVTSARSTTTSPPHGAKILKAKTNKKKHEATFRFRASGTVTGFDCALVPPTKKGKHHKKTKVNFSACRSPKTYKHLKHGKYTFEVKAFNTAGTSNTVIKHLSI
jgi:hypothetical protein